jgi:DNA adenine methylase
LVSPIVRWAGGKSWFIKYLINIVPGAINDYHEPFLGGGAIFFHLKPQRNSYLSDINADLINMYSELRKSPEKIYYIIQEFKNNQEDYYRIRGQKFTSNFERAAQFLYLNKTCFNGLYRVNDKGIFNVPYGFRKITKLYDLDTLKKCSEALQNTELNCMDFEDSLRLIKKNDLVFLDPPYSVTHIKNGFIKYNEQLFAWKDQIRLFEYIKKIRERQAFYILTNANHDSVTQLFGKIDLPIIVSRACTLAGKSSHRGTFEESVFTNIVKR